MTDNPDQDAPLPLWWHLLEANIGYNVPGSERAAILREYDRVTRMASLHLDATGWWRALARVSIAILDEADAHHDEAAVKAAVDQARQLWARKLRGDDTGPAEWVSARIAAAKTAAAMRLKPVAAWAAESARTTTIEYESALAAAKCAEVARAGDGAAAWGRMARAWFAALEAEAAR